VIGLTEIMGCTFCIFSLTTVTIVWSVDIYKLYFKAAARDIGVLIAILRFLFMNIKLIVDFL